VRNTTGISADSAAGCLEYAATGGSWTVRARSSTGAFPVRHLNLGLLGHFQSVINFNAQVTDRALQLRVTEQ
jgi:hypothetical protein